MANNPRYANGALRRKHRARLKAMGCECGICKGRYGPIDYSAPSNHNYPLSFVVDEIIPVSRWKEYGYASARKAAEDWNNLQAAHYCCNQAKSNKVGFDLSKNIEAKTELPHKNALLNIIDGDW